MIFRFAPIKCCFFFSFFLRLILCAEDVLLVTVSDDRSGRKGGLYEKTQEKIERLFLHNQQFGITEFKGWTFADIKQTSFYEENRTLLDNIQADRNGRAYKPFVIYEGLSSLQEGDFLIYSDCSPEMWASFNENSYLDSSYDIDVLKNLCIKNGDILTAFVEYPTLNGFEHTHANFTLDRCILKMGLWKYRSSLQHASGMFVLRKSDKTVKFVKDWLYWNCIDECASLGWADVPNNYLFWMEENHNKVGHRHDQSISGLLINQLNNRLVISPRLDGINPYNFLGFSKKEVNYKFINSNVTNPMVSPNGCIE